MNSSLALEIKKKKLIYDLNKENFAAENGKTTEIYDKTLKN